MNAQYCDFLLLIPGIFGVPINMYELLSGTQLVPWKQFDFLKVCS